MRCNVIDLVVNDIQRELAELRATILCNRTPEYVRIFSWEDIVKEVHDNAPSLFHILKVIVVVKHRVWWKKTKCRKSMQIKFLTRKPSVTTVVLTRKPSVTTVVLIWKPSVTTVVLTRKPSVTNLILTWKPSVTTVILTRKPSVTTVVLTRKPSVTTVVLIWKPSVTTVVLTQNLSATTVVLTWKPSVTTAVLTRKPSVTTVVGLCTAFLACNQNLQMNLVQRTITLILSCGHSSKQVWFASLSVH